MISDEGRRLRPTPAGVILAGGAARRMGGADKAMLSLDGRGGPTLLSVAVRALRAADPVIVVGPRRDGVPGVSWAREDPPRSGPVAALAAALTALDAHSLRTGFAIDEVAVLAADLTGVTEDTMARLAGALRTAEQADGAVLVDASGRRQWLIGVWRRRALATAVPADPRGASLRGTLGKSSIVEVQALEGEAHDVDTPDDLRP